MTKGRKPTPIEARIRDGNPSKRPIPQAMTVAGRILDGKVPPAPDGLDATQRAIWRAVCEDLIAGKVLDRADVYLVEAFATALGRARQARRILNAPLTDAERQAGMTTRMLAVTVRGTWTANPLLTVERESLKEARALAGELGLSAVARTRLGIARTERPGLDDERAKLGVPPRRERASGNLAVVPDPEADDDD